jgi:hypothetical protein
MKPAKDFFLPLLFGVTLILSMLIIFFGGKTMFGTANWKTYRNEQMGFEIQHPKDYVYTPCESYCAGDGLSPPLNTERTDDYYFVMIISRKGYLPKNRDFKAWANQVTADSYNQSSIWSKKLSKINNYQVWKVDHSSGDYGVDYYITDGKSIVEITVSAKSAHTSTLKTVDQIISTFKFKDMVCKKGENLKSCKLGPCCCPVGAMCD